MQSLPQQVSNGQKDIQLMRFINPQLPQILALRKNEAFEQKLLKKFAKDNHLIIWSFYFDNPKLNMKLQLITVNGVTQKQNINEMLNVTLENFPDRLKHLETIFPRIFQVPFWVRLGKFFEFNHYGMHELRNEHECELCYTSCISESDPLLNCCGKMACRDCRSKYFKQEQDKRICPFCRQPELLNASITKLLQLKALERTPFKLPQK